VRCAWLVSRGVRARSPRATSASTTRRSGCGCARTRPTTARARIASAPPSARSWPCSATRSASSGAPTRSSRRRARSSLARSTSPGRGERVHRRTSETLRGRADLPEARGPCECRPCASQPSTVTSHPARRLPAP